MHAIGTLAAGPGGEEPVDTVDAPGGPVVTLRLRLLPSPVPRRELMATAAFASAEVARMPAGSNPSYLTAPSSRGPRSSRPDPAVVVAVGEVSLAEAVGAGGGVVGAPAVGPGQSSAGPDRGG